MINENVQKLKNTIRAGRAMHGYLVTSADCDETAPEGEPSSTAELLRQCAALLLFDSEKTEMLEFSPDFYELNGGAKVEQMRMIRQELSKKAFGGNNRVVVITDAPLGCRKVGSAAFCGAEHGVADPCEAAHAGRSFSKTQAECD